MKRRKFFAAIFLTLSIFIAPPAATASHFDSWRASIVFADKYWRTELYFGTDKPGGGTITAQEWDKFLEDEVTPRFPQGFTILEGYGQYRDSNGKIVREASRVLVVFYPKKERAAAALKLEELRERYKKLFNQESVMRVDFPKPINVKF